MRKDFEINELNIQVNDLRGKFIKPTLKKVSKYENKFAKLQKKAADSTSVTSSKLSKRRSLNWRTTRKRRVNQTGLRSYQDKRRKEKKMQWEKAKPERLKENQDNKLLRKLLCRNPQPKNLLLPPRRRFSPPQGEEAQVPAEEPSEIPPPEGEAPPIEA